MIKLLILTPNLNLPGGVSNYIKLIVKELDEKKFQIECLNIGKTDSLFFQIFYPILILVQFIRLKKNLKKFQPDIVHINPSLTNIAIIRDFIFLKTIKKEGYPVLFFIHGWQKKISNRFEKTIFKQYFKKRFEMADAIVVLANEFKDILLTLGLNPNKIFVSTTMVESSQYMPFNKKFSEPYNILFCGTMKKSKGPYELLNAIPFIIEKYSDASFNFIGDGTELNNLKEKTKEMGIEKNVNFKGFKTGNDKIELFKQAHIFVSPSYSEGFPTVILEAMASGTVLIYTPVGGLKNALTEFKNGLMIKSIPPDPNEIANHIIQLILYPDLMKRISQNNIDDVREKYDVKIITKFIENRYEDIIYKKGLVIK
jgi:glycosyltransferase involved in cell wall biosynthesis